jgi:hypothetical protein
MTRVCEISVSINFYVGFSEKSNFHKISEFLWKIMKTSNFFCRFGKRMIKLVGRISFSSFGKKFEKKSKKIQNLWKYFGKDFFSKKKFSGPNFFFLFLLIVSFLRRLWKAFCEILIRSRKNYKKQTFNFLKKLFFWFFSEMFWNLLKAQFFFANSDRQSSN